MSLSTTETIVCQFSLICHLGLWRSRHAVLSHSHNSFIKTLSVQILYTAFHTFGFFQCTHLNMWSYRSPSCENKRNFERQKSFSLSSCQTSFLIFLKKPRLNTVQKKQLSFVAKCYRHV